MAELEAVIEQKLIEQLIYGDSQWIYRNDLKTEEDLWNNFRYILEQNNKERLNGDHLSDSEFEQVKNQLQFSSFYKAGEWLVGENGKVMVHVQRDTERLHLVVMNHEHIAGGSSVYEVINQYRALADEDSRQNRRFDVTLMINGLPLIHIELKNKQHSYMDGFWQIKKYIGEGKFTGIFSAVQMFVISNGVDTKYFSAASDADLNPKFISGWLDRENNPVSDYLDFAKSVLRIPEAHEMIARYTVLDEDAKRLILLRPYQIHAIEAIRDASKTGQSGYVWHTTGSGKTLTSYKATRNLLMDIPTIDKTIFLIDRKDLDTQTTMAFQAYANNDIIDVDETDNVFDLKRKLKSDDRQVIVTTIQKLQRLITKKLEEGSSEYNKIKNLKIAFVVDEAHHAVAPMLKRVIQYYAPEFLVGLTATDQRPDKKRLEEIFGNYTTELSLKDAMEKGVVARANVYRIETNIDLSHVRFNGKDYVNADLEKSVRVTSRNELIVNVLKDYFTEGDAGKRQGIIFCINKAHTKEMARLLNAAGISAQDYSGDTKHPEKVMQEFKEHKIRFLCACDMISEGWDYPELGILVMARPTLSKVLYLQQIGRGLRRTSIKKNVFVIDVVDEYGAMVKPCSMHAIFGNSLYVPFGDITRQDYLPGQMIEIDGITERVERIVEVDIHTFEEKYGDYYSQEQLAREYFVNTGTIISWIRKGKITPTVEFPFGSKKISLFSPEDVEKYRKELNIQEHNDDTVRDDFFAFLEERDYSLSYKMPFLLSFIDHMDTIGDAKIEDVLTDYIAFYQDRIDKGLPVDRPSCPYNAETLKDRKMIKSSMLTNPFEKFERKRFMYYSKDLGVISLNHALLAKMSEGDWERVKGQMREDLERYYEKMYKDL